MLLTFMGRFSRQHFEIDFLFFFLFSQKIGCDISSKLSPEKTICITYLILFSGKNKKKKIYLKMLSAEFFTQHAR